MLCRLRLEINKRKTQVPLNTTTFRQPGCSKNYSPALQELQVRHKYDTARTTATAPKAFQQPECSHANFHCDMKASQKDIIGEEEHKTEKDITDIK